MVENKILYVKGDATRPIGDGNKIIAHICNDIGGWGAGFVVAVSDRWPEPELAYRKWHKTMNILRNDDKNYRLPLGRLQMVKVEDDSKHRTWVANMIAQSGVGSKKGVPPIRYQALEEALYELAIIADDCDASVHMPRIGCGLAGGTWDQVEPLINKCLISAGIDVTVYDFV